MTDLGPYTMEDFEQLQADVKKLVLMHQQTTHVHANELLAQAQVILLRLHQNPQKAPYYQAGLPFDISQWLQWYEKYQQENP